MRPEFIGKIYIIAREDLKAPIGKWMGSAAHAAEQVFYLQYRQNPVFAATYSLSAQHPKIILGAPDLAALYSIQARCQRNGIANHLVTDFAATYFTEPTVTCLGLFIRDEHDYKQMELKQLGLYR